MGVFLCESRHGIHVSWGCSCVIMMEGGSVDAEAYQKGTLERIVFTPHRMQLFLDPIYTIVGPYLMTPNYERTPTQGIPFEYLRIYGVELIVILPDLIQTFVEPAAQVASHCHPIRVEPGPPCAWRDRLHGHGLCLAMRM